MDQKSKIIFWAMRALVCGLYLSKGALGQTLPDGKGKAEFVHNCTACHTAKLVTRLTKTPDDWRKSVDEMAARGTDGSKEDLDNVVLYLVTNFATDKSVPTAAIQSTTPSSTSGGPLVLNSSETERVKRLINENGCLACHRIEKQGAYTGPTLNALGARRSPNEIRTAIISPRHTLSPGNAGKITGEDLEFLVRYLGSLPSVDENVQK
jgi:mono/diheme cytochrome c family protein